MVLHLPDGQFFGRKLAARSTPHLDVVLTSYRRGDRLPQHAHARPYLAAVVCGRFAERSGASEHACAQGTLVVNAVGAEHSDQFESDGTEVLNVELSPLWIEALRDEGLRREAAWLDARAALARIRALRAHVARTDALSGFVVEGLCAELLAYSTRLRPRESRRAPGAWLALAERALRERFRSPPGLVELAQLAGVGPAHLARSFRARHGCSVGAFVRRLRAEHARAEVVGTAVPLAEVAQAFGYADQSHMTREFRRILGCTPGELRAGR